MRKQGADQPVHLCSLFSTFVVHCLDSKSLLAIAEISGLYLVTVAEQAGLKPYLVANPKDRFSRDMAHINNDN